jgi:hypothetical protein
MSNPRDPKTDTAKAETQEGNDAATQAQADEIAELKAKLAKAEEEKADALKAAKEAEEARAVAEAAAKKAAKHSRDKSEQDEQATLAALRRQKKYVLTVNSTETDSAPVPLGCNGAHYLIKRDTEVLVPKGIINVLERSRVGNAVQETVGDVVVTRFQSTKRFSFSYREATAEDESRLAGK